MEPIIRIKDKDIFPPELLSHEPEIYKENVRVKGIVFDNENRIALVHIKSFSLPGGGVEEGETTQEALKRECLEEIGCVIEIEKEIGFSDEYRAKKGHHLNVHFFTGKLIGEKGKPQTTLENEQGIEVGWFSLDEALNILEEQIKTTPLTSYNSCFNTRVHFAALKYFKENYAN